MPYLVNWGELLIRQQRVSQDIVLFVVFLHEWYMSQYQDNQSDRITFFPQLKCVLQTIVFYSSAYLFILFPPAPWLHRLPADRPPPAWCPSSRCPPGRWHQTPPCPTSLPLAYLTVAAHPVPHVSPTLAPFSALLWPTVPQLPPGYTSLASSCPPARSLPPLLAPLYPGPKGADRAPDYLCVAASVLCSD